MSMWYNLSGPSNAKIGPTELIYEEWKRKIKRRLRNRLRNK